MNQSLQQQHAPLDVAIWKELLSLLPDDWTAGQLTITVSFTNDGEIDMGHSINNPDSNQGICIPTETIYQLTFDHYTVFSDHGNPWNKASFAVRFDFDAKEWKCTSEFEY